MCTKLSEMVKALYTPILSSFCSQRLIFSIKNAYQMLNTFKKYSAVEIKFIVQANLIALMISLTVYNDTESYIPAANLLR